VGKQYAEGLRGDLLMGHFTLVVTVDANTGKKVRVLYNTPELGPVADAMLKDGTRPGTPLFTACQRITGKEVAIDERVKNTEDADKQKQRRADRSAYLQRCMATCKLLFGTLPKACKATASVDKIEKELRRYVAQGNPLSRGAMRYLKSAVAEVTDAMPVEGSAVDPALHPLLPLVFNPRKPSSFMKHKFNLQQDNKGNKQVKIKVINEADKAAKKDRALRHLETARAAAAAAALRVREYAAGARAGARK
jgi:hypothetical protein